MSLYCRPVDVRNDHPDTTHITCLCGWQQSGTYTRARRAYYQHNPDSEPIPLPHRYWVPKAAYEGTRPTPDELTELSDELRAERERLLTEARKYARRRWPDRRERHISRCPACGGWQWKNTCTAPRCWAVIDQQEKEVA